MGLGFDGSGDGGFDLSQRMKEQSKHGDSIWYLEYPMTFCGMELGRRVSVLEVAPGKLVLHSTGPFTLKDRETIERSGRVVAIVEATTLHDTFAKQGQAAFPEAPYLVPEGFPKGAIGGQGRSISESRDLLGEGLEVVKLEGTRMLTEYSCFHRASRTLILADLMLNLPKANGWTGWALRWLAGVKEWPAIDRPFRMAVKNKAVFEESLNKILEWDFDRVVVAHGEVVETNGKAVFTEAVKRAGFLAG